MFKILKNTIKHGYLIMLIVFFLPLKVNANSLTLPQTTLDTIATGNGNLLQSGFSAYGVYPDSVTQSQLAQMFATVANNPVIEGAKLLTVDSDQYTVRSLTQDEIDTFSQLYSYLYTSGGASVSWDDVYYVTYDNGIFSGQLYVDSSGNILNCSPSNNIIKTCFDMGFGGSVLNLSDITNIYDDIYTQLNDSQLNFTTDSNIDLSQIDTSFYWIFATNYIYSQPNKSIQFIYIPNVYDSNIYFDDSFNPNSYNLNDYPNIHYDGDKTLLFDLTPINNDFYPAFLAGSSTINNHTYEHRIQTRFNIYDSATSSVNVTSLNTFISTNYNVNGFYTLAYNGFLYDQNIANAVKNADLVSFKSIDDEPFDLSNNNYSWDAVENLKDKLDSANWTLNESFNPSSAITTTNYPITTEDVFPTVLPSDLPFPQENTDNPDLPLTDNPALEYPQDIAQDDADILASFSNLQIPILSGVTKRFPFCIPWDIRDAISLLQFSPTAPAWNFDWKITTLGTTYTYHFEGDLSDFDSLATIFRRLMLLAVILGLAFWSYKIFF